MLDCPDLSVPHDIMHHVVHVESANNPFAIGVVGGRLSRQPRNLLEALEAVRLLKEQGFSCTGANRAASCLSKSWVLRSAE